MNNNKDTLYHSILTRAADEWGVAFEDVERDIGQKFDPIVRFLAGACASELERVYQNIGETEARLQQRLARVLLPEYYHLPQPAHALATATPTEESVVIEETTEFVSKPSQEEEIALSPLWPARLLPISISMVATNNRLLHLNQRASPLREGQTERFSRLLLGINTSEPITNWQGVSLFFNLKPIAEQQTEQASFLAAMRQCRCFLNGEEIGTTPGFTPLNLNLEDCLNGKERLQNHVRTRYEPHFLTFTETSARPLPPRTPQDFLAKWLDGTTEGNKLAEQLDDQLSKPLYWLAFYLPYPVDVEQLETRLALQFNVFPVVNRKLCGAGNGEHHYLQSTTIKWLRLQIEDSFVSIRRVYEESPSGYPTFTFKPFADFREDDSPSYTLRHGGIGRWDEFNAWQRLAYVVAILQENYQHHELIQQAASALSLEDVHQLLGRKIEENAAAQKPTQDVFVLLHAGDTASKRVRVEYWTSKGARANGISAKTSLECKGKLKSTLDKASIELVTELNWGRDPLNGPQQIDAMRSVLLSRGRIVTREDVKAFCKDFLKGRLNTLHVNDGVGVDPRFDFGITRLLDVQLEPAAHAKGEDWDGICWQLQALLEQKSNSSIPIRVGLVTA